MANLSNNPARVALLTAMAESTDNGAKVWDEQPPVRNSTKRALLEAAYVKVTNKKAAITAEGRAALTKATLDTMALPTAPAAEPKADAKAKFEAARAEVVKPAKGNGKAKRVAVEAAQPAANPPEQKAEPVQQAEQPAPVAPTAEGKAKVEAPAKWVMTKRTESGWQPSPKDKLSAIIQDVYGVNYYHAPAIALIWAASQFADLEGIEAAREALEEINRERDEAGKPIAVPPYGSKLF
jgi:hypothetical protein